MNYKINNTPSEAELTAVAIEAVKAHLKQHFENLAPAEVVPFLQFYAWDHLVGNYNIAVERKPEHSPKAPVRLKPKANTFPLSLQLARLKGLHPVRYIEEEVARACQALGIPEKDFRYVYDELQASLASSGYSWRVSALKEVRGPGGIVFKLEP